ncbi:MAG: hypothetical protein WBD31_10515 [Rubripirellula sp.]
MAKPARLQFCWADTRQIGMVSPWHSPAIATCQSGQGRQDSGFP